MPKNNHEIRDPIYGFITCTSEERAVINSWPIQRLRYIHHLATTFLLYPGATHRRFEHSLGVMELATRIFDTLMDKEDNWDALDEDARKSIREIEANKDYWRRVLRMAALCHDCGHLPFSHGAEALLPEGMSHEHMTWDIILSKEMKKFLDDLHLTPLHVAKIAVGPKDAVKIDPTIRRFSTAESIISEIVVGDVFGADRMDYLIRDSRHTGVAYGTFDFERLISTLRLLPKPPEGREAGDQSSEPEIGVEYGGLQAAESLIMARYLMFTQVYFHHVRRIYDRHLVDFMVARYGDNYPIDPKEFLQITDNEVLVGLRYAAANSFCSGHDPARRFMQRDHFKMLYQLTSADKRKNSNILEDIYQAACKEFGDDKVIKDEPGKETRINKSFPVWANDRPVPSRIESELLQDFPDIRMGYVFIDPTCCDSAWKWLNRNRDTFFPEEEGKHER